jgi:hypothetical protein
MGQLEKGLHMLSVPPRKIAQLEEQHRQALIKTEKAVCSLPDLFLDITQLVDYILTHRIDVGDYYDVSLKLAQLIQALGTDTIFYSYFFENTHPDKNGRAKYFRSICRDLQHQMEQFSENRKKQRHLRVVK